MQAPEGTRVAALLQAAREGRGGPRSLYAGALILLALLSGVVLWWLEARDAPAVRVGAEVIAVLPFETSGPGVNYLAEGMADLLALNLNQVRGVRTSNARIVLRHWRERAVSGDIGLEGAIAVGRRVGATSVLTGSVLATGSDLRMSVELHGVQGGRLAHAIVDGLPGDVPGLVDRVSVALLEDIWRSREAPPRFQLSTITTDDRGAMREYLRGEAHFRRGQWGPAIAAYERAVAADTAFAIAYHRLAQAYGWSENVFSESAAFSVASAHRLSDRLPERQRRLVAARWLGNQDLMSLAPNDSLRAYLERYPDDVEAWHLLADRDFHQQQVYGWGSERLLDPVERLLALDSTLAPALVHPMQLALRYGDLDVFERFQTLAEAAGLSQAPALSRLGEALWEAPEARAPAVAALIGSHPSSVAYSALGGFRVDVGDPAEFGAAVVAAVPLLPADDAVRFWSLGTNILTSVGRMSEAADTARLDVVTAPTLRTILVDLPAVAGWIDPELVTRGLPRQEAPPGWTTLLSRAVARLAVGRVDAADDALGALEGLAVPATLGPVGAGLLEAAHGWAVLLRGDTAGGIRGMQAGLREAGRWSDAGVNTVPLDDIGGLGVGAGLSFRLVATMASWPATQGQGLRLLRDVWWPDAHYEVLRHYELGRSLERSGDGSGAATAYRRFLRLLEHADEGLLIADEMVTAREALSRLGG